MKKKDIDVAVIGGGPAGISACLELDKSSNLKVALFESDAELGGIPRSSNVFFGMRDMKRVYTGKTYADKLEKKIRDTSVDIHTGSTVLEIDPGESGPPHQISVAESSGIGQYICRSVLLATGCFEASRQARLIPGFRPAGIFTTGSLQKLVHMQQVIPGTKAVIIGSEIVSLSTVITLKKAGIEILGMIEEEPEIQTYKLAAGIMKYWHHFPIHTNTSVQSILGEDRVEGIRLEKDGKSFDIQCDTVIVTGKFRPESSLLLDSPIEQYPPSMGPVVDKNSMTSVPNIYAAGNVLRETKMHDLCALEGKRVAKAIKRSLKSTR